MNAMTLPCPGYTVSLWSSPSLGFYNVSACLLGRYMNLGAGDDIDIYRTEHPALTPILCALTSRKPLINHSLLDKESSTIRSVSYAILQVETPI